MTRRCSAGSDCRQARHQLFSSALRGRRLPPRPAAPAPTAQRAAAPRQAAADAAAPAKRRQPAPPSTAATREDQHRNVERQDQQRQQHAAAPGAQHQRRADGADQAQARRGERQRGRPAPEKRAARRCNRTASSGEAMISGSPVVSQCAATLAEHDDRERQRRQRHLLERAVVEVALEQPLQATASPPAAPPRR